MINIETNKLKLNVSNIGKIFIELFQIDSSIQNRFINTFHDKNPLHISNKFAQSVGYKSKVMNGNILNGFVSYFVGEVLKNNYLALITQSIRYKNPVYLKDTLELKVVLKDISAATNMYFFEYEFKNQSNQIVADGSFQCIQLK